MMNSTLKIDETIRYLKEGALLFSYTNRERHLFKFVKNMIMVKNNNSLFYLKIEDFKELYKNEVFGIVEDTDDEIDSNKDIEYYKMSGLKH